MSMLFWVALATSAYCIARGVVDLRQKRYVWGLLGLLCGILLLASPIETVTITVPVTKPG